MNTIRNRKPNYLIRALVLVFGIALALGAAPVEACGCGIYVPREGTANVAQERALVRWDGRREDIVMALSVQGGSKEAAWILPAPTRATVQLGDAKLFDALQDFTKPRVQKEYALFPPISLGAGAAPTAGAGGADRSVTVLGRQELGPFEVNTLAASDANALSEWLKTHGYNFAPELSTVLQPYVDKQWTYVAVRLRPGQGDTLKGNLDPLWVTFDSEQLVYPMRPSALARNNLGVFLYVLADHRVQKQAVFGSPRVSFADWIEPGQLEKDSPLAPFVSRKFFLTKVQEQIFDPRRIDDDYVFAF